MVQLKEIRPDPNQPRKTADPKQLEHLKDSIVAQGILSPILLRPSGRGYLIVFGERRFTAAGMAGLKEIPAMVREMDDDEAFEIQITENLQRADVHPLEEAEAYQAYKNKRGVDLGELSLKFSKPKEYIAHRLSFNSLIEPMKKDFLEGKMLIGHALLFARLTEADQKWAIKGLVMKHGSAQGHYQPIRYCEASIAENLILDLGKATFNIHDPNLVVAAGNCDNCPKRSGHNLLFNDITEKDKCFDGACFRLKAQRDILNKLEQRNTDTPEMPVVNGWYSPITDKAVLKAVADSGIKITTHNEYQTSKKTEKGSIRALVIAGEQTGQYVFVKLNKQQKEEAEETVDKNSPEYLDGQIQRQKDIIEGVLTSTETKLATQAFERLMDLKPFLEPDSTPLTKAEMATVYSELIGNIYGEYDDKIKGLLKKIKMPAKDANDLDRMMKAPVGLANFIVRRFIAESLDGSSDSYTIIKIAEQYKGVNVAAMRKQLAADAQAAIDNANAKIKELREKKKSLTALPVKTGRGAKALLN